MKGKFDDFYKSRSSFDLDHNLTGPGIFVKCPGCGCKILCNKLMGLGDIQKGWCKNDQKAVMPDS